VGSDLTKYQEKLIDDDYLVEADVEFINYHAERLTEDYINYISNIVLHSHRVLIMMIQNMTPADYNRLLQSRTVPRNFRSYELGIPYMELPEHVRYSITTASMTHILRRQISKGLIRPMVNERNLPAIRKVELPNEVKQSAAATSVIPLLNMIFTTYKGVKYPFPRDDLADGYTNKIDSFIKSRHYRVCLPSLSVTSMIGPTCLVHMVVHLQILALSRLYHMSMARYTIFVVYP